MRARYSTDAVRPPENKDDEVYPCACCGVLRSENQGARIFTVCDDCWHGRRAEDKQ